MSDYMSLREFLELSELRNEHVRHKSIISYVRKSRRMIGGEVVRVVDRANTWNTSRISNIHTSSAMQQQRTGLYREFDELMKSLAREYGYDGVLVENVLNEFLPKKLEEWGYQLVEPVSNPPCYIYLFYSNSRR